MPAIEALGEVDSPAGLLRCTLGAWERINARFGSYTEAYRQVAAFNSEAYVTIIAEATGQNVKAVKEAVFKIGLPDLVKPVTTYIGMLSNGGKVATDSEADAPKGEG